MTFYWLDGVQISEACAKRWEEAGWIKFDFTQYSGRDIDQHYKAVVQ